MAHGIGPTHKHTTLFGQNWRPYTTQYNTPYLYTTPLSKKDGQQDRHHPSFYNFDQNNHPMFFFLSIRACIAFSERIYYYCLINLKLSVNN